ncbi:MAG: outer membrane beta-barrel protein, partial [Bacteroidia bacterium]|nr:outer membrane beta-barrel protein [Bacteroidia bacterium]
PNTSLSWEDMDEYGLNNEQTFLTGDDGMMFMDRDNLGDGYPVNHKSGIYLNQTINKKLKVNGNYTYSYSSLLKKTTRASQYFLKDSSFTTRETEIAEIVNKKNNFNLSLELKADSLTKLSIRNQFVKLDGSNASNLSQDYNTNENITFRNSQTNNNNANEKTNNEFTAIVQRKFKKKDRELRANYNLTSTENQSNENFNQNNSFYTQNFSPLLTNQKSKEKNQLQSHLISVNYEEPITKKIKYLAGVLAGTSNEGKNRQVNNLASDGNYYNNPFFTNSFETRRTMTTVSNALNYSTKKIGLSAGVDVRKLNLDNINLLNQKNIQQNAVNALPKVFFRYSLGSNQSIYIRYNMNANLPKINYIQPIPSSLNTNSLTIGNPNLVQSITTSVNANFWVYKAISNFYYGLSANATQKNNDFALNTTYDSIGRSINKYENIQGNYSAGLSGWLNKPFFNKTLTVNIDGNVYQSVNYNFINRIKNRTEYNTLGANPGITFTKELIEVSVNGGYSYNFSKSTLYNKSNIPYAAYNAGGHITIYATKRFIIKTDVNYKVNTRRNNGYNVNLFIWNASVMYNFLKEENFSVTVDAFDILNNNLLINRNIYGNVVSDTRTAVIARYFLLSVTYRFKNQGAKKEDEVFVD